MLNSKRLWSRISPTTAWLAIVFGAFVAFILVFQFVVASAAPSSKPLSLATIESPSFLEVKKKYTGMANSSVVVVNKHRALAPLDYQPAGLVSSAGAPLQKEAAANLLAMFKAARSANAGSLRVTSGYRSFATQGQVLRQFVGSLGKVAGERLAAHPGHSEHQTGLAADIAASGQGCGIAICFAKTKAGAWLAANSWRYGWILRYPEGQTEITGYQFEPWHFRYVGKDVAANYYRSGATSFEAYWGLPPAPEYLD